MKKIRPLIIMLLCGMFAMSCQKATAPKTEEFVEKSPADPLPSWQDGNTKKAIVSFVERVTKEGSSDFVPVAERIATFDNDGTLWCEQPLYFEFVYSLAATRKVAEKMPALQKKPEIKALMAGDIKTFMKSGEKGLLEALAISHTLVTIEDFDKQVQAWLDTAVHSRYNKKYTELTYKPMVELLTYLRANEFKTYIVTGGSSMFVRQISEKLYGVPPEQVVGTMFKGDFVKKDSAFSVVLKSELMHLDDNVGKPVGIYQFIGRKPILAFGNSDGDLQMLEWTSTNKRPNLSLILHHTDSIREVAYDRNSHIGKLDKALTEGQEMGWIIVDMKTDFAKVFSYE